MLKHFHLIVRAEVSSPPIRQAISVDWMTRLVERIGMELMPTEPHMPVNPISCYLNEAGNRGLTTIAVITTSNITLHVWDEVDPALLQLDVYTCGELNIHDVFHMLKEFDPQDIEYVLYDREDELKLLKETPLNKTSKLAPARI